MKKILSLLTLLTVLSVSTVGAYASTSTSDQEATHSGWRTVTSKAHGISLSEYVSGGTYHETGSAVENGDWYYGFSGSNLFSQYDNSYVTHKASVKNSNTTKTSGWVEAGQTAYKSMAQTWTGNQCFWGTK